MSSQRRFTLKQMLLLTTEVCVVLAALVAMERALFGRVYGLLVQFTVTVIVSVALGGFLYGRKGFYLFGIIAALLSLLMLSDIAATLPRVQDSQLTD